MPSNTVHSKSVSTEVLQASNSLRCKLPTSPEVLQQTADARCQDAKFLQRLLESSQDCIKVLDLQGKLIYMNHIGQRIMEIDDFVQQVQHQPWLSFWHGEEQKAACAAFEQACRGETGRFDGYCATAKGSPKWWDVVVTPIFDDDNQIYEILSVSRDITLRKKAELAVEQRNRDLDEFTSIASHDLKAPLRGISSLASWIAEDLIGKVPAETRSHLVLLQQRVHKMQALIDGLLEVSKVGREEIADEEVDVAELLSEIIDSIAPPAGFLVSSSAPLPKILAKRLLLSQVMSNLISNAIKHHDKETGRVEVVASDCDGAYKFEVVDDGPGIPPNYRQQIFEMFQTLSNDEDSANTGLGLALVKKIVEAEGGRLWIDEDTQVGSRFCFTWPKR